MSLVLQHGNALSELCSCQHAYARCFSVQFREKFIFNSFLPYNKFAFTRIGETCLKLYRVSKHLAIAAFYDELWYQKTICIELRLGFIAG